MQSILVYGTMFTSSVLLANRAKKTGGKGYLLAIILILSFVCGCRSMTVGIDTNSYYILFKSIVLTGKNTYYYGMEKGFEFFCCTVLALVPSTQFLFFLTALITFTFVICRLWEFHEIAEFDWMVACFLVSFYTFLLSGIRQGVAVAIVFWGTRFLEKKKYVWYVICVILAGTFHKTAVLACLSFLWELRFWGQLSKKNRYFLALCVLAMPAAAYFLMQNYTVEQYSKFISVSFGKRILVECGFGILSLIAFAFDDRGVVRHRHKVFLNKNHLDSRASLQQRIATVKVYYAVGVLIQLSGYISSSFARSGLYWYWFESVFMGMMVKSKKNQRIFRVMFFLFLAYICYSDGERNGNWQLPYLFFWQA